MPEEGAPTVELTADAGAAATPRPAAEPDLLLGQAIGGYRVVRRIGAGGMGAVYAGVHPTLGKRVAIKVLRGVMASEPELRRRFEDEARAAAQLASPHIVAVRDFAELPDGRCYMVMELLEGEAVSEVIGRLGVVAPADAVAIVAQALEGLGAAHARGIVHRDVKPGNLFIAAAADGPCVKVLDFGIAKLRGGGLGATGAGAVLGTPTYMSPEQASGKSRLVDGRADLYSMAVVLFELVTGRPPFRSDSWAHVLVLHQTETPPPLLAGGEALSRAVMRALAKDPAARFATAEEMRVALLAAAGGGRVPTPVVAAAVADIAVPPTPTPVSTPREDATARQDPRPLLRPSLSPPALQSPRARRTHLWAAAVGLATVAAVLIGLRLERSPRDRERGDSRAAAMTADAALVAPEPELCTADITDARGRVFHLGGRRGSEEKRDPHAVYIDSFQDTPEGQTELRRFGFSCVTDLETLQFSLAQIAMHPGRQPIDGLFNSSVSLEITRKELSGTFTTQTGIVELRAIPRRDGELLAGSFESQLTGEGGSKLGLVLRFRFAASLRPPR